MPKYTKNLGLSLPLGEEYFNINSWNANMRILDEAFALISDESGETSPLNALSVGYDSSTSQIGATNVQDALDRIATQSNENLLLISVTEPKTIDVPAEGHLYVVLAFGATMYNVTFNTTGTVKWESGVPSFAANNVYELSFLNNNCRWFKRMQ